jgi:hypothetical protein
VASTNIIPNIGISTDSPDSVTTAVLRVRGGFLFKVRLKSFR